MAILIKVTSFTPIAFGANAGKTATEVNINTGRIISVQTTPAYQTTGVTTIQYQGTANNMDFPISLIVTETAAAILTAANAQPA